MTPTLRPTGTGAAHRPAFAGAQPKLSPLVLADRLITLAQEADRAGLHDSAARLVGLMYAVLDDEAVIGSAA